MYKINIGISKVHRNLQGVILADLVGSIQMFSVSMFVTVIIICSRNEYWKGIKKDLPANGSIRGLAAPACREGCDVNLPTSWLVASPEPKNHINGFIQQDKAYFSRTMSGDNRPYQSRRFYYGCPSFMSGTTFSNDWFNCNLTVI